MRLTKFVAVALVLVPTFAWAKGPIVSATADWLRVALAYLFV
jgi:hypothetical protein